MLRRLKGYFGNVPVRLVLTFLVAILIPSLLVTSLGLIAVHQADSAVISDARQDASIKLQRLREMVGDIWRTRVEHFREILQDADERPDWLARVRSDEFVDDILLRSRVGLRLIPEREPAAELDRFDMPAEVRRIRLLETDRVDRRDVITAWTNLRQRVASESVQLEASLGEVRAALDAGLSQQAQDILDALLVRYGHLTDETGVLYAIPLILFKLETLEKGDDVEKRDLVGRLERLFDSEKGRLSERQLAFFRVEAQRLTGRAFSAKRASKRSAPVKASDLARIDFALRAAQSLADGDTVSLSVDGLSFGEGAFLLVPTQNSEIFACLLLNKDAFFDEYELLLDDLSIPDAELRLGRSRGSSQLDAFSRTLASQGVPEPFQYLEWRYVPEQWPVGFRGFEIFTAATFSWAVVILTLTIVAGGFLTLRSVLREMKTARMKTDFVSFVTHELKTPLSAIRMFSETLMDGRVSNPEEEKLCLQMIDRESERLTALIDRILEFSKIQNNQKVFEFTSCSMEEVVDQAVRLFREHPKHKSREVEVSAIQRISKIKMDRTSMIEVVLNLLSNASKYSTSDKPIVIHLKESINEITVDVIDRGVGIRKRDLRRIFDKFFRAEDYLDKNVEGYGLGLAFARYIARQHKGDIRVTSQVNSGSTFTLCLQKTDVLAE